MESFKVDFYILFYSNLMHFFLYIEIEISWSFSFVSKMWRLCKKYYGKCEVTISFAIIACLKTSYQGVQNYFKNCWILGGRGWHCTTSSTCALTGFFWLLSHVIYLKLTKCFLSQTEWWLVKVLFLSLRLEAWTFWKLNIVNPLRFTSHQKKLKELFTF